MNTHSTLLSSGFSSSVIPVINQVSPNISRSFDGFSVSYNRSSRDYGTDTTAMVVRGRVFMLLRGNHALELAGAAEQGGLIAAVTMFIMKIEMAITQSEHLEAFGLANDPFDLASTLREALPEDQYTLASNTIRASLELAQSRAQHG